ncbi:peptidyl-prolyl cis-trans isomerase [Thalassotalea litorea]|uniref:Peptidyl-prolyl cis-trans isomerase n=1 Tax=Thalassotalea litorea TaxID=2020715 RepID=A0A5R9INL9_9GAMM|nr:peptidylprolyl isomerase [Thalassotalea litorea]TLU67120.1 peptidyl-prolyl cis-trans isomerase [Thalassotalea litorea]
MLTKIIKEPLTHFFLLAALIVLVAKEEPQVGPQHILVSAGRIDQLSNDFARRNERQPTQEELEIAVESFALNQVYLHQARKLGLNINDRVIDRRLRQKMEYLLDEMAILSTPDEQQLSLFYHQNIERYQTSATISFAQVYISNDRPEAEFTQLLATQQSRIKQGQIPTGDHILLPENYQDAPLDYIGKEFGLYFSQQLAKLPLEQWHGPITSSYGQHFVRLVQRQPKAPIPLANIKRKVILDWQYQQAQIFKQSYEQTMLQEYEIEVRWPQSQGETP